MKLTGLKKLREVKKALDTQFAAGRANYFALKASGDSARVRFNCREDEPVLSAKHYNSRTQQYTRHREEECVLCFYKERGHKAIGSVSGTAAFNLIDCRYMHVEESATKKRDDGKARREYTACTEDATCKGCRRKLERERGGQKYWEMAMTHASNIDIVNRQLSKKCNGGCEGKGKIIVLEYECTNCGAAMVHAPPQEGEEEEAVTCMSCNTDVIPAEILQCSVGCDVPTRGSIVDCDMEITRSGMDTKTTYNFVPQLPFSSMEDWMLEYEPVDLSIVLKEPSHQAQAKDLKMKDPYASKSEGEEGEEGEEGGAEEYGEDAEETEEAVDDEDPIADPVPRRAAVPVKRPVPGAPARVQVAAKSKFSNVVVRGGPVKVKRPVAEADDIPF